MPKANEKQNYEKLRFLTEKKPCLFVMQNMGPDLETWPAEPRKWEPKLKTWSLEPRSWGAAMKSVVFVVWDTRGFQQHSAAPEEEPECCMAHKDQKRQLERFRTC